VRGPNPGCKRKKGKEDKAFLALETEPIPNLVVGEFGSGGSKFMKGKGKRKPNSVPGPNWSSSAIPARFSNSLLLCGFTDDELGKAGRFDRELALNLLSHDDRPG
jgi:hypothetical protein